MLVLFKIWLGLIGIILAALLVDTEKVWANDHCITKVSESIYAHLSPDLVPRVTRLANRFLSQPTSEGLSGAPAFLLLQAMGIPNAELVKISQAALITQIEHIDSFLSDGGGLNVDLTSARRFLENRLLIVPPSNWQLPLAPNEIFQTKWQLPEFNRAAFSYEVGWRAKKADASQLGRQLLTLLELADETGQSHLAHEILVRLIHVGDPESLVMGSALLHQDAALINLAKLWIGHFLANPLAEQENVPSALLALHLVTNPNHKPMARAMLHDFAIECSSPNFRPWLQTQTGSQDFRVFCLEQALAAVTFTGELEAFHFRDNHYSLPAAVLNNRDNILLAHKIIMSIPDDLFRNSSLPEAVLRIARPAKVSDRMGHWGRLLLADAQDVEKRLLAARFLYASSYRKLARDMVIEFLSAEHSARGPNGIHLALQMMAEAQDSIGFVAVDTVLDSRIEHEAATHRRQYIEIKDGIHSVLVNGNRWRLPTTELYLRAFEPWVFEPGRVQSILGADRASRRLIAGALEVSSNRLGRLKWNAVAREQLRGQQFDSAGNAFVMARNRRGLIRTADKLARRSEPELWRLAFQMYAQASLLANGQLESNGDEDG